MQIPIWSLAKDLWASEVGGANYTHITGENTEVQKGLISGLCSLVHK